MKPGAFWLALVREDDPERFDAAFVEDVRLDLAILDQPMTGADAIWRYLTANRGMLQAIEFTHQADAAGRTYLSWEGRFADRDIAGATVLVRNADGAIENVQIYHRPYDQATAFAAELVARLETVTQEAPLIHQPSAISAVTANTGVR